MFLVETENKSVFWNNIYKSAFKSVLDNAVISMQYKILFTPQPLRAVGVLFSPMVSGWAGGRQEKVCPGCIPETVRCRKLILGRDIG